MTDDPEFWNNRFHAVALAVGFVAHAEGWLHDSERVRRVAYHLYERGAWPTDARRNGKVQGETLTARSSRCLVEPPGGSDARTFTPLPGRSTCQDGFRDADPPSFSGPTASLPAATAWDAGHGRRGGGRPTLTERNRPMNTPTPPLLLTIDEFEFRQRFPLVPNSLDANASWTDGDAPGSLFDPSGAAFDFVRAQAPGTVWTLQDGDGGQHLRSGVHIVNRIGYLVSRVPVPAGVEIVVPLDAEPDD